MIFSRARRFWDKINFLTRTNWIFCWEVLVSLFDDNGYSLGNTIYTPLSTAFKCWVAKSFIIIFNNNEMRLHRWQVKLHTANQNEFGQNDALTSSSSSSNQPFIIYMALSQYFSIERMEILPMQLHRGVYRFSILSMHFTMHTMDGWKENGKCREREKEIIICCSKSCELFMHLKSFRAGARCDESDERHQHAYQIIFENVHGFLHGFMKFL